LAEDSPSLTCTCEEPVVMNNPSAQRLAPIASIGLIIDYMVHNYWSGHNCAGGGSGCAKGRQYTSLQFPETEKLNHETA
jgi:hypothetical protein